MTPTEGGKTLVALGASLGGGKCFDNSDVDVDHPSGFLIENISGNYLNYSHSNTTIILIKLYHVIIS